MATTVACQAGAQVAVGTTSPSTSSNCASTDPSAITSTCSTPSILTSSGPTPVAPTQPQPIRNTYDEFINMYKQGNGFKFGGPVSFAAGGAVCTGQTVIPKACNPLAGTGPNACTAGSGGANLGRTYIYQCMVSPSQVVTGKGLSCEGFQALCSCIAKQVGEALPYVGNIISGFSGCTTIQTGGGKTHHGLGIGCSQDICQINGESGYGGIKNLSTCPYYSGQGQDYLIAACKNVTQQYCGCTGTQFEQTSKYNTDCTGIKLYPEYASCGTKVTGYSFQCDGHAATCYDLISNPNNTNMSSCACITTLYPEYNHYLCEFNFDQQAPNACWVPPWEGGNSICPWDWRGCNYIGGTVNNYTQLGPIGQIMAGTTCTTTGTTGTTGTTSTTGTASTAGTTGTAATTATGCPYANSGVPGATQCANTIALQQQVKNATNPTLTCAETDKATLVQNSACQNLCDKAYNVNTPQVNTATGGNAQTVNCVANIGTATYTAAQTCPAFTIKAANGQVDPCAITSNQLQKLTCFKCGTPGWAQPAINTANAAMAARGLGSSTIMGGAYVNAIESAALPVAQANASYFANLDTQNLTNDQQAVIASAQINAQAMLSNTAATNAAAQFNAQSENQTDQFMANLNSQIQLTNAAQVNAMQQFNAGQINSVDEFNANMQNNVDQFNASNQLAIDQSNVTWRRNINTVNTAAENAAAQTNAQNAFNLSSTAQNNLWQEMQDQASWANTDAQNNLTRAQNLAIASLGVETATSLQNSAEQAALMQYLGGFGLNIASGVVGSIFNSGNSNNNSNGCSVNEDPTGNNGGCNTGCDNQCYLNEGG